VSTPARWTFDLEEPLVDFETVEAGDISDITLALSPRLHKIKSSFPFGESPLSLYVTSSVS